MMETDKSVLERAFDEMRRQARELRFYRMTCWFLFALLVVSVLAR